MNMLEFFVKLHNKKHCMKIDYHNMPFGVSKTNFIIRYIFNIIRTWYLFHLRYPWVKYNGFVRVMKGTTFAHRKIELGHNVQFGQYCNIASNVHFGNNILMAGRVCFVGKHDHTFDIPEQTIWQGERGKDGVTIIEDDVWIGTGAIIIAGVKIGKGSIVAAGSIVTKDIPKCEIWGGNPARKIRDRFHNEGDKLKHLHFLNNEN